MANKNLNLNISGMTCVNCSNAVEKVTKKLPGIEDVSVSFASSKGEFTYDSSTLSEEQIIAKIQKLGYGVSKDADSLEKAKAENMPNDNIDRAIKKASGDGDDVIYEEILYEGYGPEGVAVMVTCLTDNRNRTAADVRHAFDKYGGNLGQTGSVAYLFNRKGLLLLEKGDIDEETLMMDALDAGDRKSVV